MLELSKLNPEVAGEALHFVSRSCLSRMQRFKQEIIPVVYMRRLSSDDKIATKWGDIWSAVTDSVTANVNNLYTKEIVAYALDGLTAAEWQLKRQAALALEQLAWATDNGMLEPFSESIVNAIVSCIKSSGVWDGKDALLLALGKVVVRNFLRKDAVETTKECTVSAEELTSTLGREARRVLGRAVREARDKVNEKAARYSSRETTQSTTSNESQTYCQKVLCCVRKLAQAALVFREQATSDSAMKDHMGLASADFFTPVQPVLQRVLTMPSNGAETSSSADAMKYEEFETALRAEALQCLAVTCTHSLVASDDRDLASKRLQEHIVLCCNWVDSSQTSWTVALAGLRALQSLLVSTPALTDTALTAKRITGSLLACLRNTLYAKLRVAALEFLEHKSLLSRLLPDGSASAGSSAPGVWAKLRKFVTNELDEFIEDSSPRVVELCCDLIEKFAT